MRITNSMLTAQTLRDLQSNYAAMARAQEQVSSGKRLNRPSDNPPDAQQAIKYNQALSSVGQYLRNVQTAQNTTATAEGALASAGDSIQRLKELSLQAANDTLSPTDRASILAEVNQLADQLVSLANTKNGDDYVFSGQKTTTPAYANPSAVYGGDTSPITARIAPGQTLQINVTADTAFGPALAVATQLAADLAAGNKPQPTTIQGLDDALSAALTARTKIGAIDNRLTGASTFLADQQLSITAMLSNLEDADMPTVISEASTRQTAYQAAISINAKILQKSLIDEL
jgi:flagellar hook-associated protein 3 FlgL